MLDSKASHNRRFLLLPFLLMLSMWVVFWLDQRWMLDWVQHGLEPKTFTGLQGIIFGSFLHGSMEHLANNSLPVLVLGMGLIYYYPKEGLSLLVLSLTLPWIGVWFFARPAIHIGASAAIYSMATFLFFSGLWKKNRYLLATALLVVFLYGSLFWGLFPIEERISHEGHISGAVVGLLLSVLYRKKGPSPTVWHWDEEDDDLPEVEVVDAEWIQPEESQIQIHYTYLPNDRNSNAADG